MKKKTYLFLSAALVTASLGLHHFSSQASSLGELTADASGVCTPASNSDCESSSTGNIYTGYRPGTQIETPQSE